MKHKNLVITAMVSGILSSTMLSEAMALEVDREVMPRITLGGRVMTTLDNYDWDTNKTKEDEINLEDSAFLARFDKRVYDGGVAGAILGFKEDGDAVKFHQLNAFYWNKDFAVTVGRTRLRNTLIEFPTIRDDDLKDYTHVANASSNDQDFDGMYGKVVTLDFFDSKLQSFGGWVGTRRNGTGFTTAPDGIDSYGLNYVYEVPDDTRYVEWIRHAGVSLDSQKVQLSSGEDRINSIIAGIEFNLNMRPDKNWSMAVQAISTDGAGTITSADIVNSNTDAASNRARAASTSLVTSIRYTGRPKLLTRWQAALTAAYKDYSDVSNATQWSIAPSFVYTLGQGVDLLAQVKHTSYGSGLGDGSDNTYQVGISFSFDTMINDNIGERKSILGLEHGYIKR